MRDRANLIETKTFKTKKMTKEDFLNISSWRTEIDLEGNVYSSLLGHNVIVQIGFNQFKQNREISEFSIKSLNEFLQLDKSNIEWIKSELWKSCEAHFQTTSYTSGKFPDGAPRKEGQSEYEANQDLFGIYNSEDAFRESKVKYVVINNDYEGDSESCFWLEYVIPWDREHNLVFVFVNGKQYAVE
jgi:hypothetical protein